jgi:hypothetical protein
LQMLQKKEEETRRAMGKGELAMERARLEMDRFADCKLGDEEKYEKRLVLVKKMHEE